MRTALLLVALLTFGAAPALADKLHVDISGIELPAGPIPPEAGDLKAKISETLADLVAKRPELSASLDGAPDPTSAAAFRTWAAKKHVKAFTVQVKVTLFSREVAPNTSGKRGQVLTEKLAVSLIGTTVPDGLLGLSGEGRATIAAEVGEVPTKSDESSTTNDLVREALTQALDEAVKKASAPPPAPAKKPANKKK